MAEHWDKVVTRRLLKLGLTHEQAALVVGEIAEQRQQADRQGYNRGHQDGYKAGYQKGCDDSCPY